MLYRDFLKSLQGCPFCEEGQRAVIEKEHAYLTYAIAPYHKHHLLVIPRRHTEIILDLSPEEVRDMESLQEEGLRLLKKLGYKNLTVLEREGDNASKSIAHLHTNLIPNVRVGDVDHEGNERRVLTEEEIDATLAELKANL